ncbi:MAG TPA: FG-GAP-like repeat-containing protein [Pyrinomonadaceae bacterium]|nr:FG-GAP-like repeat-containing protein [Pyrinomonadaceae bacterium]
MTTCLCLAASFLLLSAAGAAAQQCTSARIPRWRSFDTGAQPNAFVKGDFNADGKLDLAAAVNFPGAVAVLLGDGAGGFSAPSKFSVPATTDSVTSADFNGDGKLDVAVSGHTDVQGSGVVYILLGDGAGGFGSPVSFNVGRGPATIAAADFNGDGKQDVAVALQIANNVTVVFGDGQGGFNGSTTLNGGDTPFGLAAADLNGDGRADLVSTNVGSNNVSVFLNGAGGFGPTTNYTVAASPRALTAGDLNNDGKPDLAVVSEPSASQPGSVSVLLGDGAGGFGAANSYAAGIGSRSVAVGDFNADGKADLAAANYYSHDISILTGDGAGHFTTGAGYVGGTGPMGLAVGDFNNDGKTDLAALDQVKQAVVLLAGRGDGSFNTPPTFVTNAAPMSAVVGDFNGDGKMDAAVAHFSFNPSKVSLHLGDGKGGLRLAQSFDVGADPRSLLAADFNRDGKLDLATVNTGGGNTASTVSVLLGDGAGGFAAARTFPTGSNILSNAMRAGDFNNDGKLDLAVANNNFSANGTVSILLGDGAGDFGAPTQFGSGGNNAVDVAPGDFNGDGKLDLLVANGGTSSVSLLVGDGAGGFAAPANFAVGSSPRSIAVGDFNGDGRADAAVANYGTPGGSASTVSVLLGNGSGGFVSAASVAAGPEIQQLVAADVSADGKLDLITKSASGEILILKGDGAGNFSPLEIVALSYGSVAAGDLNGDGLTDLVNSGANQLTVLLNSCVAGVPNPIDDSSFFVRQHYLDFLNREPDATGFQFWTNEIESCGADAQCREVKRINVSAAFFLSIEFQETGYLAYRTRKAAFGNLAGTPVPVTRAEMVADASVIGNGVIVNAVGWEQKLEQNKRAYFDQMVASQRFVGLYPQTLSPEQFVDALNSNAGGALSSAERDALVADLKSGAKTRAQVLRAVAEDADLTRAELNRAFVLMEYVGYLRRDPNAPPDVDFTGYNFWLGKLNQFNGDYIAAEMVKAFISSDEYRNRFAQ